VARRLERLELLELKRRIVAFHEGANAMMMRAD
jgi:hypothetical protein